MATVSAQRGTVLGIVNEVQQIMGYTPTATLSANRTALKYLSFLNDTVIEVADYGDWPQLYEEVKVTAGACANTIEVNASAPVKRIYEVHEGSQVSPLVPRDVSRIRLLERSSGAGAPRQFALVNTSGINPILRFHPRRTTAMGFNIACYTLPVTYTSGHTTLVPPFSNRLLVNGVHARALLDENDGVETTHYQSTYLMYRAQLKQEYARLDGDTGTDVYLVRR